MTLREALINLSEERRDKRQYLKKMDKLVKAKKEADSKWNYKDLFLGNDEKVYDAYKTSLNLGKRINNLEYDEPKYDSHYKQSHRKWEKAAEQNIRNYNRHKPPKYKILVVCGKDATTNDYANKDGKKIHYSELRKGVKYK